MALQQLTSFVCAGGVIQFRNGFREEVRRLEGNAEGLCVRIYYEPAILIAGQVGRVVQVPLFEA